MALCFTALVDMRTVSYALKRLQALEAVTWCATVYMLEEQLLFLDWSGCGPIALVIQFFLIENIEALGVFVSKFTGTPSFLSAFYSV